VYSPITVPMQSRGDPLIIPFMAKPGRRPGTPTEYRLAFIAAVLRARKDSGLEAPDMARELQKRSGRVVSPDTYRKYETLDAKTGALLPHDLIVHFCEITRIHPLRLLDPPPFDLPKSESNRRAA
jgi:hypothetical protein